MPRIERFKEDKPATSRRARLHEIIFEADTPAGRAFDILLILSIALSVVAVMLESVASIRQHYGRLLHGAEWLFTILFTIEYVLRLSCVRKPWRYATSFFGVIDLLAVIPTYLDLLLPGTRVLLVIRILRLLRIFRVLKLVQYVGEAELLLQAMRASRRKILVFLFVVVTIAVIIGSTMYVIEGPKHGFTSIPQAVYWAIVTLTTVGYGDISPGTAVGQTLASVLMIIGYSIIAVPTGIVSAEMVHRHPRHVSTQACPHCASEGHEPGARFCKDCGGSLDWDDG
jgi:voltage-gated potassium channel